MADTGSPQPPGRLGGCAITMVLLISVFPFVIAAASVGLVSIPIFPSRGNLVHSHYAVCLRRLFWGGCCSPDGFSSRDLAAPGRRIKTLPSRDGARPRRGRGGTRQGRAAPWRASQGDERSIPAATSNRKRQGVAQLGRHLRPHRTCLRRMAIPAYRPPCLRARGWSRCNSRASLP